jgi:hypothetical protein
VTMEEGPIQYFQSVIAIELWGDRSARGSSGSPHHGAKKTSVFLMLESWLSSRRSAHRSSVASTASHVAELRRSRVGHTVQRPLDWDRGERCLPKSG